MSPYAKAAMSAWLESLSGTKQPDGLTTAELGEVWGTSKHTTLGRIRKLIDAGRMAFSGRRSIKRIDGRPDSVPVYQLVKGARK